MMMSVYEALLHVIGDRRIDVVLSDLAPNLTGQKSVDQPASIHLLEIVLDLARRCLRPGGSLRDEGLSRRGD